MGFSLEVGVSAITVFVQGILSFFSPCVLPLVPLYIGYLAGGTKTVDGEGNVHYKRSKVLVNTMCFVLGVSFAFFLLGFGFTAAGRFLGGNKLMFAKIGAIIVILFGLYQLGVFGSILSGREHRLPVRVDKLAMNPITALVMGFTFSFAWTPCVGPALASVLLMASSASSSMAGFVLIGVYTIGFVLPFLAVGLFTGTLLELFKRYQKAVAYTVKAGGVLMILMGVMMWTGWMNGVTGYLSGGGNTSTVQEPKVPESKVAEPKAAETAPEATEPGSGKTETERPMAPDFTLMDQNGNTHTLSDYRGKTIFLNFWATWCGPCRAEMPDIQAVYEEYGKNEEDVVVLGIANPRTEEHPNNSDVPEEEIVQFLTENQLSYPVVMDPTGDVFREYGISVFPTTFMITGEGEVMGYASGTLTKDIMETIIKQTMEENADQ